MALRPEEDAEVDDELLGTDAQAKEGAFELDGDGGERDGELEARDGKALELDGRGALQLDGDVLPGEQQHGARALVVVLLAGGE